MLLNIFLIIGVCLIGIAGALAAKEHRWLCAAQVTEGRVTEMIATRGSKGKASYKPRVEFTGMDGARHTFVRSYSTSPPEFTVGEKVAVAYDAAYSGRILTFGQRFGFALILGAIGLMLATIGGGWKMGRHFVPRVYFQDAGILLER